MTDKQKQWIAWIIVAVAIVVAGFLGVTYPVPAPPQNAGQQVVATAIYPTGAIYFAEGGKSQVFQSGSTGTFLSGAKLDARSGATVLLNTATITNAAATIVNTTNLTATNFSLNGITLSGGCKYGTASSVVTGTLIAHSLATTPTFAIVEPSGYVTATPNIVTSNATSMTVGFIGDNTMNPSAMSVRWEACK